MRRMKNISNVASVVLEEKERLESLIHLQEMKINALSYQLNPDQTSFGRANRVRDKAIKDLESIRPYVEIAEMEAERGSR